jgi:hypothetical protein
MANDPQKEKNYNPQKTFIINYTLEVSLFVFV